MSERIREVVDEEYVRPARANRRKIRIRFGDLQKRMQQLGLPQQNVNQVASAIETFKFWQPRGLEMCSPKNQPRKVDSVFEFRFIEPVNDRKGDLRENDPLLELAGVLKGSICEGVDAFIRNIRMDKENAS